MALATQCPHCQTTFRVAHDQLKLRAGLVRCGACKQIFNGIENLLRPEEMEQVFPPTAAPRTAAPAPSVTQAAQKFMPAPAITPQVAPSVPVPFPSSPPFPPNPETPASTASAPDAAANVADEADVAEDADVANVAGAQMPPSATADTGPVFNGSASFIADSAAREAGSDAPDRPSNDPLLRMTLLDVAHRGPLRMPASAQETDPASDAGSTTVHPSMDAARPETGAEWENANHIEQAEFAGHTALDHKSAEALDDGLEKTIDDLQAKPWRNPDAKPDPEEHDPLDQADIREYEEPSFVRQGRRKQRLGKATRILMLACVPLLLLALVIQVAYIFRNHLLVRWPQTQPMLAALCQPLQCELGLPAQIEQVALESSELQAATPADGTLNLTALLRNHSGVAQTWPHVELTLNDSNEKPIARRVFMPRDYLPAGTDVTKGFPAKSEQAVKMRLELDQLKASGFRVYLFYP
jgi:predicted Zn finger-like uncharacterized protein